MKQKLTAHLALGIMLSLLAGNAARAQIGAINPVNSFANIKFNDTLSLNPINPGGNYWQLSGPWVGTPNVILSQVDPVTLDVAYGDVSASGAGASYAIAFNTVTLAQAGPNIGLADLFINFYVEYNITSPLTSQPTLFPTLFVNGTVQSASTSYALVNGTIDYYDVNASGPGTPVDSVRYNYYTTTPGTFTTTITGVPMVGTTPTIPAGDTLALAGNFQFEVDPATFNLTTVPEPAAGTLLALAAACGMLWRRRVRQSGTCRSDLHANHGSRTPTDQKP